MRSELSVFYEHGESEQIEKHHVHVSSRRTEKHEIKNTAYEYVWRYSKMLCKGYQNRFEVVSSPLLFHLGCWNFSKFSLFVATFGTT